jgi:hypothetical protein
MLNTDTLDMSEDKMPDVIYAAQWEENGVQIRAWLDRVSTRATKYYSESHVQDLIDQAKAEQREVCLKAALSQCNTKSFYDKDYLVECGDIRHAILNAETDK